MSILMILCFGCPRAMPGKVSCVRYHRTARVIIISLKGKFHTEFEVYTELH